MTELGHLNHDLWVLVAGGFLWAAFTDLGDVIKTKGGERFAHAVLGTVMLVAALGLLLWQHGGGG